MKTILKIAAAATMVAGMAATAATAQEWPNRPVTLIVAAGAGGGTDATARWLAADLEQKFGQPFNVVNRAEGGGISGITEIANAEPDGYTLGILFNYAPFKLLGMGDLSAESYTPIAQYNFDYAAVHVKADSNFQTLAEVVDKLKSDSQSITIGCGAVCPSSWSSALSKVLIDNGIDIKELRWVPSAGAAAGLQELTAGGVDILTASVPEAGALIDAGEVRTLAVLSPDRLCFPGHPDGRRTDPRRGTRRRVPRAGRPCWPAGRDRRQARSCDEGNLRQRGVPGQYERPGLRSSLCRP